MSELTNILNQFVEMGFTFNIPANQDQLNYLLESLEIENLEEIFELYRHHNGMPLSSRWELFETRLMSIEETIIFMFLLEWRENPKPRDDSHFLWVDINYNILMGIYISGPLKGKIFTWETEEDLENFLPKFRSISSLYQCGLNYEKIRSHFYKQREGNPKEINLLPKWQYSFTDYPSYLPNENAEEDLKLALTYIDLAQNINDEEERRYYSYIAINLMPYVERGRLLPFLDSPNTDVKDYAMTVFIRNIFSLIEIEKDSAEEKILELAKKLSGDNRIEFAKILSFSSSKIAKKLSQLLKTP